MVWGYTTLYSRTPRSFLFAVVANVGPGGASRPLAVAYRQGCDRTTALWPPERVHRLVADTLALIELLSDPANRAPLEAERALAKDWYHSPQPPFVVPDGRHKKQVPPRPQLPWHDDTLSEFPFITTCLLLGLLRDDSDAINSNSARPGDVQLQPLSTMFRGDCTEYGLVVIDISDLDSGVKYGIVAFRMHYMAEVRYRARSMGWDPVEDEPPLKEPDVVLESSRPRVPLSIHQWLRKYHIYENVKEDPSILRLKDRPLVDAAALDYFRPSMQTTRTEDASTTKTAPRWITSQEPLRNAHIDCAIDNLLLLTQEPTEPPFEKTVSDNLQKLAEYREQLRQRLEEVPDTLGPSEISSYILRVAYAGRSHLNWVVFQNLAPSVIAAAIASDELRDASAVSLCVDQFRLEGDEGEGDLGDLATVLAQTTALKQLCFLQRPDRDSDDASARFCSQLLLLWGRASGGDLEWLRTKTIYPTSAFSTSLRSRGFLTSSLTISLSFTSPDALVFPVVHMFTLVNHHREDGPDVAADHHVQQYQNSYSYSYSYSDYYAMENTLLDAESFAVRFLAYLRSLGSGSGSEKAILRFAHKGASSSLTTTTTTVEDGDHSPPSWSSSGQFSVSPIPAGFFDHELPPNDSSKARPRDTHPGSWVVLIDLVDSSEQNSDHIQTVAEMPPLPPPPPKCNAGLTLTDLSNLRQPSANMDRRGRSCSSSDDGGAFLQYSFVKVCRTSAEIAPEQQQQRPVSVPNLAEVVGGLTNFLRETAPGSDVSTWEELVEEVERDLRTRRASIGTGKRCIDIRVMAKSRAHTLLNQLL
ncbi:hypothetical protein N7471_011197 [Penicillium samsonianum]|uniref:uncharacterized protein n=1 Tax=Penicillium samsonianum TaxID=1882272 RepID=UPI002546A6C4|nr:uncharacterized protein N7471_011197 [Penicillium samsonianum]KAJ6123880.1 hypothetical protein N7471_011197 [Penicillium samsonianum]